MRSWSIRTVLLALFLLTTTAPQGAHAQTATPTALPDFTVLPVDPAAQDIAPVPAQSPYRLILLVPFPDDPFWQEVQQAVTERAALDGVTVDVMPLSEPSVPEQLDQIEQAIANGYAGILIGVVDAAGIAPGIASANAAGIPVLAIDIAPVGGEVISVVRTDNVAASRLAGQFVGTELDGEGAVLNIQGDLSNPVAQERDRGFRDGIAAFEEITVISNEGSWSFDSGRRWASNQLPQPEEGTPTPPQPLVDAVFAAGPDMTLGAVQAVEEAQADSVFVVGFGATSDALDAIQNGILEGVVAELPIRAGVLSLDLMVQHLNGVAVPVLADSGFVLVNSETIDAFRSATS